MVSNVDMVNQTLAEIGSRSQITSMTDGSPEARYASLLYNALVGFLLREGDYDFALFPAVLTPSGLTPTSPWNFSYSYPSVAVRIRSLLPALFDPFDVHPVEFNIVNLLGARYIVTKEEAFGIFYTAPTTEDLWDPLFQEAFRRLLGSALAFALQNRIEASKEKLTEALNFAGIANLRES
jgi:hypothetical protein